MPGFKEGDVVLVKQIGMYSVGNTRQWMSGLKATIIRVNPKTVTVRFDHYQDELWRVDRCDIERRGLHEDQR